MNRLKRKGFYIKEDKTGKGLILNIFVDDFVQFIGENKDQTGWTKLRIYERNKVDEKGFTHNMEAITHIEKQHKTTSENSI